MKEEKVYKHGQSEDLVSFQRKNFAVKSVRSTYMPTEEIPFCF